MYHVRLAKLRNDATLHEFSYILRNLQYIHVIVCLQNRKSYDVLIIFKNFKDQGSDRYESREKHFSDFLYTFSVPSNILMSFYLIKSIAIFSNFFYCFEVSVIKD